MMSRRYRTVTVTDGSAVPVSLVSVPLMHYKLGVAWAVQAFLGRVKLRIPMLEVVVDSMVQYISVWQSLYYYGWAL